MTIHKAAVPDPAEMSSLFVELPFMPLISQIRCDAWQVRVSIAYRESSKDYKSNWRLAKERLICLWLLFVVWCVFDQGIQLSQNPFYEVAKVKQIVRFDCGPKHTGLNHNFSGTSG